MRTKLMHRIPLRFRGSSALLLASLVFGFAASSLASPTAGSPSSAGALLDLHRPGDRDTVSVYAGVYTSDQANRGEDTHRRSCAACHSTSEWQHGRLLSGWSGESVYELVNYLRNIMPMDAPGSLSVQEYTDIFAFVLELNSVPSGESELASDEERLRQIVIEYRRE